MSYSPACHVFSTFYAILILPIIIIVIIDYWLQYTLSRLYNNHNHNHKRHSPGTRHLDSSRPDPYRQTAGVQTLYMNY